MTIEQYNQLPYDYAHTMLALIMKKPDSACPHNLHATQNE